MAYARYIKIGSRFFTDEADSCSFNWDERGCAVATIGIDTAGLADNRGVKMGDDVIIYRDAGSTIWWRGIVANLGSSLSAGLVIQAIGTRNTLVETVPTGWFGTNAGTGRPSNFIAEDTADADADWSALNTTWAYLISAIDPSGETLYGTTGAGGDYSPGTDVDGRVDIEIPSAPSAGTAIKLSWTAATNATAYRVYRHTAGALGSIDFDVAGTVYWETSELEFTDNGLSAGTAGTYTFRSLPGGSPNPATNETTTISDTDVQNVVKHLVSTFAPSGITYDAAKIMAGGSSDLDDYDLRSSDATLDRILDSLADFVGSTHWFVDENNKVNFAAIGTSNLLTLKVYEGASDPTDTNVVVDAKRNQSRDGITMMKIDGEEVFEDEDTGTGDVTWDSSDPTALPANVPFERQTADHRVVSTTVTEASPTITVSKAFIDGFATLDDWLQSYPNQRWIYLHKDEIPEADVTGFLQVLKTRIESQLGSFTTRGLRPRYRARMATRKFPGFRKSKDAGLAASNWLAKYSPSPETWNIALDLVDTLIKPFTGKIQLDVPTGERFSLDLVKADYVLGQTITLNITGGDRVYSPDEEEADKRESIKSLSMRRVQPNTWSPNSS